MTGDSAGLANRRVRVRSSPSSASGRASSSGALSFCGFALGAFLGTRLAPLLLPQGSSSPYAPAFGLLGALLGGAILASGLEGVGFRLRRTLIIPGMGTARRRARRGARRGAGARDRVDRRGGRRADARAEPAAGGHPALGDPAQAQRGAAAVGADPERARAAGSAAVDQRPLAGRRRAASPRSPTRPACRRASRSVVRVDGTACGLAIEGSGWVAAPDVVVTNAHVVAGETDTTVEVGGQLAEPARRADRVRTAARHRRAARAGTRPAVAELRGEHRVGHRRRDPRLSGERAVRRAAGADRAHADGDHPERLRPGPGLAAADAAARARATGQLGRAAASTSTGRC